MENLSNNNRTKSWVDNKILAIILCFVFFPVGLYMVWKGKYSTNFKYIMYGIVLIFLVLIGNSDKNNSSTSSNAVIDAIVEPQMDAITNKVARDAEEQYYIAERQGDPIAICVHAGMVAAAYLQAKDEPNYIKWKEIEKQAKIKAGL